MNFILWDKGNEQGPYDLATVQNSIQQGKISPKALARLTTETSWRPLETLLPQPEKKPAPVSANKPNWRRFAVIMAVILGSVGVLTFTVTTMQGAKEKRSQREHLAEQVQITNNALNELMKLNSVTSGGINFLEYSRRVLDAKSAFDALMRETSGSDDTSEANEALNAAMNDYLAAKNFWDRCIRHKSSRSGGFATFSEQDQQPYLQYGFEFPNGFANEELVPVIWGHASQKLQTSREMLDAVKAANNRK